MEPGEYSLMGFLEAGNWRFIPSCGAWSLKVLESSGTMGLGSVQK